MAPPPMAPPPPQAMAPVYQAPVQQAPVPQAPAPMQASGNAFASLESKLDTLLSTNQALANDVKIAKNLAATAIGALHHIYLATGTLGQGTNGQANTIHEFMKYMERFIGSLANPS
jgi:hypothetical protein